MYKAIIRCGAGFLVFTAMIAAFAVIDAIAGIGRVRVAKDMTRIKEKALHYRNQK